MAQLISIGNEATYIIEPYHVLWYESMKKDGSCPRIIIGKFCSIAFNCTFVMSHHNPYFASTTPITNRNVWSHGIGNKSSYCRGDIVIGNDVWIGANCTLMDNITIGDGAVIATGSVVTKDVAPYSIVGGNPCKFIRYRFSQNHIDELMQLRWWDLPQHLIDKLDLATQDIDAFIDHVKTLIHHS